MFCNRTYSGFFPETAMSRGYEFPQDFHEKRRRKQDIVQMKRSRSNVNSEGQQPDNVEETNQGEESPNENAKRRKRRRKRKNKNKLKG